MRATRVDPVLLHAPEQQLEANANTVGAAADVMVLLWQSGLVAASWI
jgi:hypothetical protein